MGEYYGPIILMKYLIIILDKDIPVYNFYLSMFFFSHFCQKLYIFLYFKFRIITLHVIPRHIISGNPSSGAINHMPINSSDAAIFFQCLIYCPLEQETAMMESR